MVNYNSQCLPSFRQGYGSLPHQPRQPQQQPRQQPAPKKSPVPEQQEITPLAAYRALKGLAASPKMETLQMGVVQLNKRAPHRQAASKPKTTPFDEYALTLGVTTSATDEIQAQKAEEASMRCLECGLPIGDLFYSGISEDPLQCHAECYAQIVLQEDMKTEKARKKKDAELKAARRQEYDIGWKVARVPRNLAHAAELGCSVLRHDMCCLKLVEWDEQAAIVAPTLDPAASVNLEYLSLALQCRQKDGMEPRFSLDPRDPTDKKCTWQEKHFEPAWIAGTSVGEVMFQADVHLKELSMGEYEQPVLGMRSVMDFQEDTGYQQQDWHAREWFVVNNAAVQLSKDRSLIPHVIMGVEAREQLYVAGEMQDAKITRPDHPMVQYAELFTHYFDLIAERKSVMYHLRELAKAAVLAKHLTDINVPLEDKWYNLASESEAAICMEVPQLWNARTYAEIDTENSCDKSGTIQGIYGGVAFGLDQVAAPKPAFKMPQLVKGKAPTAAAAPAAPRAAAPRVEQPTRPIDGTPMTELYPGQQYPAGGLRQLIAELEGTQLAVPLTGPPVAGTGTAINPAVVKSILSPSFEGMASAVESGGVVPFSKYPRARAAQAPTAVRAPGLISVMGALRGVDLNLDQFNLSAMQEAELYQDSHCSWTASWADEDSCYGDTFWSKIDSKSSNSAITDSDKDFLNDLFCPSLSDRREEGELFVPPKGNQAYVEMLRTLLAEEKATEELRKDYFFSEDFKVESPGQLFPHSWASTVKITRSGVALSPSSSLQPRPEYVQEPERFEHVIKAATPVFDKSTEGGTRYRIYHVGTLEVRTSQERDEKEIIGMIYAKGVCAQGASLDKVLSVGDHEEAVHISEYVEQINASHYRFYVVIQAEDGGIVVTEKSGRHGEASWAENPHGLDARSALAKVCRSASCHGTGLTISDLKSYVQSNLHHGGSSESYARGIFDHLLPARVKAWGSLTAAERAAAEHMGVQGAKEWDEASAQVWATTWDQLTQAQRASAATLGFDETCWAQSQKIEKVRH
mmetsp:Transcript_7718/g.14271  ORF Transcript_7718/g.14271 Transcript_7718/m.14271 type:complete len:1029 (-) Transcript_7718:124-3210(-)